jgi:MFS family permease
MVGLAVTESRIGAPLLLALGGIASAIAGPALGALYYETAPDGKEGTALGVYSTLGAVGGSAGPLLGGAVASAVGVQLTVLCIGVLWLFDTVVVAAGVRPAGRDGDEGGTDETESTESTEPHPN